MKRATLVALACMAAGCGAGGPDPQSVTCEQVRHDRARRDAVISSVYHRLRHSVRFRLAIDRPEARDYIRAYVETLCANSNAPTRDRPYRQAVDELSRPELWP